MSDRAKNLDYYLGLVERVIALLRPKFYNRLTWVVVLAGLVLMASPWWADLANALASRLLGVSIPSSDAHLAWGLALVVTGLLYHITVHYLGELIEAGRTARTRATYLDHDRKNFAQLAGIMSEDELAATLADLRNQHAYESPQFRSMDRARRYLLAPDSQFIEEKVQAAAREYGYVLSDLLEWVALNFFVHGPERDDGFRFCLHPELHEDRAEQWPTPEQMRLYSQFQDTLNEKVREVDRKYTAFRTTVKRSLAV